MKQEAPPSPAHTLHAHPAATAGARLSLSARVRATDQGWDFRYHLQGPIERLRIPPVEPGGPADGLWQHTCFEAFVAADGLAGYREFNFSPSGRWAAYRFQAERERDVLAEAGAPVVAPAVHTALEPDGLVLNARLPPAALPAGGTSWSIGLCAVVEEIDGRLSYWALKHPRERPDFHHRNGWVLHLAYP